MAYLPLSFPAGIVRPGTRYDARGRWWDANLCRWHQGAMQPIGGWQKMQETTPSVQDIDLDGPVRGLLAWRANSQAPFLAMGTHSKFYTYTAGVLNDATPAAGFTAGGADAVMTSGNYGEGLYGVVPYGTGDVAQSSVTEANTWAIDTFGEDLVCCAYSDGNIYYFDTSAGGDLAALSNAPTSCKGVVVTPERFIVALGASADGRLVKWASQETTTTWTATTTNTAGDFILPGTGQIMCGLRSKNETLIWTDTDLFAMRYIGGELVYSFPQIGNACGIISRRAATVYDGRAAWMSQKGFFVYDGFVKPLHCDVGDYVFGDMNRVQASKIFAVRLSEVGETTWFYPSAGATEIDRYVTVTDEGHWQVGRLQRTSFVGRDAFGYPIGADANGAVYQHETGTSYLDHNGDTLTPYAESGPIELGAGDNIMHVQEFIPDERTLGDAQVYIYSAMYPTATETTHGPYTLANPTSTRLTGRQVRVRVEQVRSGWRFGTPRLGVVAGGMR